MSEHEPNNSAGILKTLSVNYRRSILTAIIWFAILALWCAAALDTGESLQAFLYSLGVYFVLLLLIMLRRPAAPSRLDLLVVGWGLPILFFSLLFLLPVAWHIRGFR